MQKVNTLEQQWQEAAQSYVAAKLSLANILQARITADFEVADDAAYGDGRRRTATRPSKPHLPRGRTIGRRKRTSEPPNCR